VTGTQTLERWLRGRAGGELEMDRAMLIARTDVALAETDFPATLSRAGVELALRYRFAPGTPDDGVTVEVPLGLLESILPEDVEWMVRGMLEAQVEAWLRTLPKQKRKLLAPLGESAERIARHLAADPVYRHGRFLNALGECVQRLFRVDVVRDDWDVTRVPVHLQVNVQVQEQDGKRLAEGRDLDALRTRFTDRLKERVAIGAPGDVGGLIRFPPDGVASEQVVEDGGGRLMVYPALVDEGETVALRAFANRAEQAAANRLGYPRMAWLVLGSAAGYFRRELDKRNGLKLRFATLGDAAALRDDVLLGVAWYVFFETDELPATAADFAARIEAHRPDLAQRFTETVEALEAILVARADLVRIIDELRSPAFEGARRDVSAWLERRVPARALSVTPGARLAQIPDYLEAARYRLSHLQGRVERDARHTALIADFEQRLDTLAAAARLPEDRIEGLRFRIEDLRVALFAEPLAARLRAGPGGRVSEKRVQGELLEAERLAGLR
jgi:ATP-dependent helicase HrpA